jgi:hypothetical protein
MPRVKDPAARFENQGALELWRAVSCWNAMGAGNFSLHFVRNKEHREVDFPVANDREPLLLVEAKLADERPTKPLLKIQRALRIPGKRDRAEFSGAGLGRRPEPAGERSK